MYDRKGYCKSWDQIIWVYYGRVLATRRVAPPEVYPSSGVYSSGEEYPGILTNISVTAYEAVLHSKCKD